MENHKFGGDWTEEKLERLKKYSEAYMTIFKNNLKASYFTTHYVDAFAGTGYRNTEANSEQLVTEQEAIDSETIKKGSAYIALETSPSFDRFLFIEQRSDFIEALGNLKEKFPSKGSTIEVRQGEANQVLRSWMQTINWKNNRALVFLDPYGMQIEWETIEAVASTEAIDLWLLFPLGQAVNRLLTKRELPNEAWASRLDKFFGTNEWREAFYREPVQVGLFDDEATVEKSVNLEQIGKYFNERLRTIFSGVASNPLPLKNSKNVPLYLLCFAAGNPRGAPTAIRIAESVLREL